MTKKAILLILIIIKVSYLNAQLHSSYDNKNSSNTTYITGTVKNQSSHDTLTLILNGPFFSYQTIPERFATHVLTTVTDNKGQFKFSIETINSPFHVSLFLSCRKDRFDHLVGNGDLANYLINPRDSVHIDFTNNIKIFTGRGAILLQAQYQIEQTDKGQVALKKDEHNYLSKTPKKWLQQKDSLLYAQLNVLSSYQSKLSSIDYNILRADLIGSNRVFVYQLIRFTLPQNISKEWIELYEELEKRPPYINLSDNAALSPRYVYYIYEKLKLESVFASLNNKKLQPNYDYFDIIKENFNGVLRDKLLTWWIIEVSSINSLKSEYIENALSIMQTPLFIKIVESFKDTFAKEQQILDFEFKDPKDQAVRLSHFKGKIIVLDMWFTGCSGCKRVAAGLPFVEKAFLNSHKVIFASVSIDKDKKVWLYSIDRNHGKYFITTTTTYLNTAGTGEKNDFIKKYVPDGTYPSMLIINTKGQIYSSTPTHPVDAKSEKLLIAEIKSALASK